MKVEFKAVKECRAIMRGFVGCKEDSDMGRGGSDRHRYDKQDCEISLARIAIIPAPFGFTDRAQVDTGKYGKSTFLRKTACRCAGPSGRLIIPLRPWLDALWGHGHS